MSDINEFMNSMGKELLKFEIKNNKDLAYLRYALDAIFTYKMHTSEEHIEYSEKRVYDNEQMIKLLRLDIINMLN